MLSGRHLARLSPTGATKKCRSVGEMLQGCCGQTWAALVTQQICKTYSAVSGKKRSCVDVQRWGFKRVVLVWLDIYK